MLRGLWGLSWLEIKIFVREPLGVIGTIGMPVLVFVVLGRVFGGRVGTTSSDAARSSALACRCSPRFSSR